MKNFLSVTLLSFGIPMITMGDEVRRTQHGNNNAYCHNDESVWFDWTLLGKQADVHRFVKLLIQRRRLRDLGPERQRMALTQLISQGIRGWHGVTLNQPDWSDNSHSIGLSAQLSGEDLLVYLIFNTYWEQLEFEPPLLVNDKVFWHRWIDTYLDSPQDIVEWQTAPAIPGSIYKAGPRSVVVLWANCSAPADKETGYAFIRRPITTDSPVSGNL